MTHAIDLTVAYATDPDALESKLGDETVILHLRSGTYFGIDAVGSRIWELLQAGKTPTEICEHIRDEFSDVPEALDSDIGAFLGQLVEKNLISPA